MEQALSVFSTQLADLVEQAAQSAVAIEARPRMGSSGFFWKPGIVITADHAIRREEDIPVTLPNGNQATAQLAGRDAGTDIAVLRVDAPAFGEFTPAPPLRTGELVLSIGRHEPGVLASLGVVSTAGGEWKTWRGGKIDTLLRIDIGAYPRSSGSALIDSQGRLAGMLTGGLTRTAPVGVPLATINRVATEILEHGAVARGYIGVGLQPIPFPASFAKASNREQRAALIVLSVAADGPAAKAGILVGDVIAEIAGHVIEDTDDVQTAIQGATGKTLSMTVFRGGERAEVSVVIGERRS